MILQPRDWTLSDRCLRLRLVSPVDGNPNCSELKDKPSRPSWMKRVWPVEIFRRSVPKMFQKATDLT